jgi:hypothetical protein
VDSSSLRKREETRAELVPAWRAEQNNPFLPERDLRNLIDGDQQGSPKQAGAHREHVRTVDPRMEMHFLDDAHPSAG